VTSGSCVLLGPSNRFAAALSHERVQLSRHAPMKSNSIIRCAALNLLLMCEAQGQASFELANHNSPLVDAPVFDAQSVPLAGTNYLAELWGAATPDSLAPCVLIDRGNSREIVPFLNAGYFIPTSSSVALSVPTVPPGGQAWLQVRAWDARLGATYEDAFARGLGGYGESPLFYAQGGNPFGQFPIPGPLVGLQSFNLRQVVPEPSAPLLLLVGLPLLFIRRRRGK